MSNPFTLAHFQEITVMDPDGVQAVVDRRPQYLEARSDARFNQIMARLRKRYDVAVMSANPPETVKLWWVALLTKDAYAARGFDPSAKDDEESILGAAREAEEAIKEAADSEKGLYELPLLQTLTTSGVSRGAPLAYSEASPYTAGDILRRDGSSEDSVIR